MVDAIILENQNGYVTEDKRVGVIKIYTYSVADYDGIKDKCTYESWYNYITGLWQSWNATGYQAGYADVYKDREYVLKRARKAIEYKED